MRRKGLVITIWVLSLLLGWFLKDACAEPLSATMALIYGSAIGAGGSILGGLLGKSDERNPEDYLVYKQLPDYPESTGAREDWWGKLQEWGKDPNYGAIPQNWDEIWGSAKDKISRYYWGGVNDPGLAGKVRASAARRNVSQSPALENMLTSMGMQEKIDLAELATTQASQQAEYGEKGRSTWLNSMMALAGMKPAYVTGTGATSGYGVGNMVSDVSSGIGGLFNQYAKNELLTKENQANRDLWEKIVGGGSPATTQASLTSDFNPTSLMDYFKSGSGYGLS